MKDNYRIVFIRGATTATGNTEKEIEDAVVELIDELISRNNLIKSNLLSITFTATKDLDACFPASIARKCNELNSVAFLDCQQMYVSNDVDFCIRIMAQVLSEQKPKKNLEVLTPFVLKLQQKADFQYLQQYRQLLL